MDDDFWWVGNIFEADDDDDDELLAGTELDIDYLQRCRASSYRARLLL